MPFQDIYEGFVVRDIWKALVDVPNDLCVDQEGCGRLVSWLERCF